MLPLCSWWKGAYFSRRPCDDIQNISPGYRAKISTMRSDTMTVFRGFNSYIRQWTFLESQHTEQGARIVKAQRKDFEERPHHKRTSNNIVFKSSIAKILTIVIFLKIIFIMDFDDFLFRSFFLLLFDFPRNSRGTPVDPSRNTSLPRHTGCTCKSLL
jgi:hypothetical protein